MNTITTDPAALLAESARLAEEAHRLQREAEKTHRLAQETERRRAYHAKTHEQLRSRQQSYRAIQEEAKEIGLDLPDWFGPFLPSDWANQPTTKQLRYDDGAWAVAKGEDSRAFRRYRPSRNGGYNYRGIAKALKEESEIRQRCIEARERSAQAAKARAVIEADSLKVSAKLRDEYYGRIPEMTGFAHTQMEKGGQPLVAVTLKLTEAEARRILDLIANA